MVRAKHRYIVLRVQSAEIPEKPCIIKNADLYKAILNKVRDVHGEYGLASIRTGFTCKYCNELTNVAICKLRHGPHRFVTSILPLIVEMAKQKVQVRIIHLNATIRQAYKFLLKYQKLQLENVRKQGSTKVTEQLSQAYLDLTAVQQMVAADGRQSSSKLVSAHSTSEHL